MPDLKSIKKAGGPLGFAADVLSLAQTNWGLIVSLVVALGAGLWKDAFALATNPHIQVIAGAFLFSLWTYIALSVLYRVHTGIKIIPVLDYAHSLIVEGTQLAFDKNARKDAPALQVGVNLRNVANGPISVEIHEYRVVVGGRALPDSPMVKMILPRMGPKGLMSGTFNREAVKDKGDGSASLVLYYGPPGGPMARKYTLRMNLIFGVSPAGEAGVANQIALEEDVPL